MQIERNRRIARGDEVTIGRLESGLSIVEPPADPAALGALNRTLESRGVGWSYGMLVTGSETGASSAGIGGTRVVDGTWCVHAVLRKSVCEP